MDQTTANECRSVAVSVLRARCVSRTWTHHLSVMDGWLAATLSEPKRELSNEEMVFLQDEV